MKASDVQLPDNWIRKESKSRPSEFYYFNKKTGMSQWTFPISSEQLNSLANGLPVDSSKSRGKSVQNQLKISNQSIEIKKSKQQKTPAQNRLENFVKKLKVEKSSSGLLKNVVVSNKLFEPDIVRKISAHKKDKQSDKTRSSYSLIKPPSDKKRSSDSLIKQLQVKAYERNFKTNSNSTESNEELPNLFPPRTPGQDRLNRLRNSLNPSDESKSLSNEPKQQALCSIRNEFGLSDSNNQNASQSPTIHEDEPMDWEPSEIFQSVENKVYNDFTNLSYIVPDTNVFLDGISCIKDTIHRSEKYNVLVPYAVLQELDGLKSRSGDSRISRLATGAIRFINNELKSKTQRLQGQKATEDNRHIIDVSSADDKILNCCLQMTQKSMEVVLITNDINLSNKAMASGIKTMTSKEYQEKKN